MPNASSNLAPLEIHAEEYRQRRQRVFAVLQARHLDALCVFGPTRVAYLSGFFFSPTERPMALILTATGQLAALLPNLELSHFEQQGPPLDDSAIYPEYPGGGSGRHPLLFLRDLLGRLGVLGKAVAADVDGYEHRWGYRGPSLSAVLDQGVTADVALIDDLRMIKSGAEIALMSEACRWGDHAHRLMQEAVQVGARSCWSRTEPVCRPPARCSWRWVGATCPNPARACRPTPCLFGAATPPTRTACTKRARCGPVTCW